MQWTLVSPGIWTAEYEGYHITKILNHIDVYGKDQHSYIAVKGSEKFTNPELEKVKARIDSSKQTALFL